MKKNTFNKTIKIGKDISVVDFIKSRIVSPKEIAEAMKNPIYDNDNKSIRKILFNARYLAGKAIEGYDFI